MPANEMTDEMQEAYRIAYEEWLGVLAKLWTAQGRPIEPHRMYLYAENLAKVPFGLLEVVIDKLLSERAYSNVPTLGEIWSAIKKEGGESNNADLALESWRDRQKSGIYRVTRDGWIPL
jgi:hypothetical protein